MCSKSTKIFIFNAVTTYTLTWFFVLKLLEQSSAYKSHVILSNFQGSEPRFEWYSLSTSWFQKKFCVINFYFDIHFCQNYNWRFVILRFVYNIRVTRNVEHICLLFWHFWNFLNQFWLHLMNNLKMFLQMSKWKETNF